jgi:RimJ/RimL family protein N-acetyltransferase
MNKNLKKTKTISDIKRVVVVETENFYICPYIEEDFKNLLQLWRDHSTHSSDSHIEGVKRRISRFIEAYKNTELGEFMVFSKSTNELIGRITIKTDNRKSACSEFYTLTDVDFDYIFFKKFQNRTDFAVEASVAILDYAFKKINKKDRILSTYNPDKDSKGYKSVLEKIGFTDPKEIFVGEIKERLILYELKREDFYST